MEKPLITVHTVTVGQTRLVRLACVRPDGAEIDIDLTPEQAAAIRRWLHEVLRELVGCG